MTSSAFDLSQFGSRVTSLIDPDNRIINGAFDFWQRGTSSTAAGFLADRWNNGVSGGTVTTSRQAFSAGDTFGSNNPSFFFRQAVSGQSASSHYAQTTHPIEGVRSYAGQTITLLGWARRSSGSGNAAIDLTQYFGSGGSPSGNVSISPQTLTLTGSWAAFALTFAIPSISGKTIGTNNNDYLTLNLWTSAGSNYNARTNSLGLQTIGVDLWGIHIKLGSQTVDAVEYYRQPELGPELARCQRYYERITHDQEFGNLSISGAYVMGPSFTFSTRKRVRPSMSTNISDANYSTQWGLAQAGLNVSNKSGTVTIHLAATQSAFGVGFFGATYSPTPNSLRTAWNSPFGVPEFFADAEL
jgi:hypothetical protein